MSATTYAQQSYGEMQVLSADPRRLVILLFEGAHKYLLRAQEALSRKEYESLADNTVRAQRVYRELCGAVDEEAGGELARGLKALYAYLDGLLQEACLEEDEGKLQEALGLTVRLAEAWKEAEARCQT